MAETADRAGTHSTAPALLLQALAALGRLSDTTNTATDGGRRPFRIPHDWEEQLSQLAYVVYLLADQTAVDVDEAVRGVASRVRIAAADERARSAAQRNENAWF